MGEEILMFGKIQIDKKKFLPSWNSYSFRRCRIQKVLVSDKISYDERTVNT